MFRSKRAFAELICDGCTLTVFSNALFFTHCVVTNNRDKKDDEIRDVFLCFITPLSYGFQAHSSIVRDSSSFQILSSSIASFRAFPTRQR